MKRWPAEWWGGPAICEGASKLKVEEAEGGVGMARRRAAAMRRGAAPWEEEEDMVSKG